MGNSHLNNFEYGKRGLSKEIWSKKENWSSRGVLNEGEGAAIYTKAFLIRSIPAHGVYAPTSSCLSRWLGCIHSMLLIKKKKLDFDPDFFSFRVPTSCISLTASYCGLKFYFLSLWVFSALVKFSCFNFRAYWIKDYAKTFPTTYHLRHFEVIWL